MVGHHSVVNQCGELILQPRQPSRLLRIRAHLSTPQHPQHNQREREREKESEDVFLF